MSAPAILALPPGRRPTINTLRHLFTLQLELEKRLRDGPYDEWDGALLARWRDEAEAKVRDCAIALEVELEEARHAAEFREELESVARFLRVRGLGERAERIVELLDNADDVMLRIF